jgi:hypothetical protein
MVSAMTPESAQRRDQFFALTKRFIRLGCLLTRRGDFNPEHADEYGMVLEEMRATRAAMDEVLADEARANKYDAGVAFGEVDPR